MSPNPSLSIIIVTFNPGDLVFNCLESVQAGNSELDVEIIVVDNASSDGALDQVKARFDGVKIIARTKNLGFAVGSNQGLSIARGEYLLLLNPDVIVQPDTFTTMIRYMASHPDAGIIGPRIYDEQGRVALTAYPTYAPGMILWQYLGLDRVFRHIVYGRYRKQCQKATEAFSVETVQGSCFMLRRQVYQQIGGLDESFFLFCEEPDFCERARSRGWKVFYVPDAQITHYESSTVSRYTPARVRSYHLSPLIYFRKRSRHGAVLALKLGFSFELLLKLILRLAQLAVGRSEFATHVTTYVSVIKDMWVSDEQPQQ